jgi:hypothetical protein
MRHHHVRRQHRSSAATNPTSVGQTSSITTDVQNLQNVQNVQNVQIPPADPAATVDPSQLRVDEIGAIRKAVMQPPSVNGRLDLNAALATLRATLNSRGGMQMWQGDQPQMPADPASWAAAFAAPDPTQDPTQALASAPATNPWVQPGGPVANDPSTWNDNNAPYGVTLAGYSPQDHTDLTAADLADPKNAKYAVYNYFLANQTQPTKDWAPGAADALNAMYNTDIYHAIDGETLGYGDEYVHSAPNGYGMQRGTYNPDATGELFWGSTSG